MAKFNASEHWARARLKRPTLSQVISRYIAQEAVEFSVKFPNSRARHAVDEAMARVLDVVKDYDRVVEQVGVKKKKTPLGLHRLGRPIRFREDE